MEKQESRVLCPKLTQLQRAHMCTHAHVYTSCPHMRAHRSAQELSQPLTLFI